MNIKTIIRRLLIVFSLIVVAFTIGFYLLTNGKGICKLCGRVGYSETIKESKERGVFIRELESHEIVPDTLELTITKRFFLEKGFRYGEYNARETDSLTNFDEYKYRLGMSPAQGKNIEEPYLLYCNNYQMYPPDTCTCEIWTGTPPFDSSYKVGELLLY